ncbi:MAG: bifunctional (p)ppGpp synthetase/guanosine-3',5'-bis(diphosphate) 3'-pyrophosphohydrolase [Candidatus Buchananbacteria bacterium]|nr:bifunctional (p)ppGpp synthetase/guanosine-3',5'-bis(diphosphate) 3'-pyrophosphohydrolase [Candidatus Buchananbacteria bacterium]
MTSNKLPIEELFRILKENHKVTSRVPIFPYLKRAPANYDFDLIKLAYEFAEEAHKTQNRKSGEPYINHPLRTAITVAKLGLDQDTVIAALLHDVPEDTTYSLVEVEKNFGEDIAKLVGGISKLGIIKYRGMEKYAENLRKMFISMAQDIRIILIKMADRLDNLRSLEALPKEKQKRIAQESLEIYAPIANRLGMGQIKGELEDLSFPYVYPQKYEWMKKDILPKIELKMAYINRVIKIVEKELAAQKIKTTSIHGRQKRLYSLYLKLQKPHYNGDVSKIYDLVALRIIVPTVEDCYQALGVIHKLWKPLPGRIKDYIAQPKPNGYQSLHSTVFCTEGKIVEFQIRTPAMHDQAENGIAAHWQYKEKESRQTNKKIGDPGYTLPKKLTWIEDLVKWQKEIQDNEVYLQSLTIDFFQNRIFVFTPKGDVIDLPEGATPVDFAYHVHSWIGDHCAGARINNQIASLDSKLKNGDVVDIITDKNRRGPSRDWLQFVKTGAAKGRIKSASQNY